MNTASNSSFLQPNIGYNAKAINKAKAILQSWAINMLLKLPSFIEKNEIISVKIDRMRYSLAQ